MHTKRVARGAAWLDKQHPYWFERVNTHTLNPYSPHNCVVGQVFGDYTKYMQRRYFLWLPPLRVISLLNPVAWMAIRFSVSHGFELGCESDDQWRVAWLREIRKRREKRVERARQQLFVPAEWEREKELV